MLQVFTYNAGKGDCIRLRFAESHNIFIDTGVIRFSATFQRICNQIRLAGESLDALILTHVDDDHIGGILGALRHTTYRCPFNEVWMNHSGNTVSGDRTLSVQQNDEVYSRLMQQRITVRRLHEGDCIRIAGAVINVYWPRNNTSISGMKLREYRESQLARHCDYSIPLSVLAGKKLPSHDTSQNNKNSVVFSFSYDNHSLLFTGDAWAEDVVKAKGNYDLVKLPHHGSARNISESYKDSIQSANFLVCTDGSGHPDKQTIAKLEKWFGEINIFSPTAWWKQGYFCGNDRSHSICYYQKEGLVIEW